LIDERRENVKRAEGEQNCLCTSAVFRLLLPFLFFAILLSLLQSLFDLLLSLELLLLLRAKQSLLALVDLQVVPLYLLDDAFISFR